MAPASCMSDGNCAFDVMLFHDGGSRTAADIKNLRHELANVVLEHSGEEAWQTAFQLSGEDSPEEPPSASPQSPSRGESPSRLRGTSPQAGTPPPRWRGTPQESTPPKTSREKLLDNAIAWKLGVKRPPKYLLSMALEMLPASEKEDLLRDYERDVIDSKDRLRAKLNPVDVRLSARCVGRKRTMQTRQKQRLEDGRTVVVFLRACGIDLCEKLPSRTWRRWVATTVHRRGDIEYDKRWIELYGRPAFFEAVAKVAGDDEAARLQLKIPEDLQVPFALAGSTSTCIAKRPHVKIQ